MRESHIEREVCRQIRERGGWTAKLIGRVKGLPDRICCLPGHGTFFIEFKAAKGKLSAAQEHVIDQIRAAGGRVLVVRKIEDIF